MIHYIKGNLFNQKVQTLVNTVNCTGYMGKGIALEFKKKFPEMYKSYRNNCDKKLLKPGMLILYKKQEPWVLNFPTKDYWKYNSKISYIEEGLKKFVETYKEKGITSIAFPWLGCTNGGLNFEEVKPLMEKYLNNLDIEVIVVEHTSI